MNDYLIRFNQRRGQPNFGTIEHVWRVFENEKEYLFKHIKINVPVIDKRTGENYNIACRGVMTIDYETSTAIINEK